MNHVDIVLIFVMCLPWLIAGCSCISGNSVRDGRAPVIKPACAEGFIFSRVVMVRVFPSREVNVFS